MSENTKLAEVKKALSRQQRLAQRNLEAQLRSAKTPAMTAYQQKQITAEEYLEATGETYAETCKDIYTAELNAGLERMATRVKAGYLTEEEYEGITGRPYPSEEEE